MKTNPIKDQFLKATGITFYTLVLLGSIKATAHAQDIAPIKEARNEAKALVKNFGLEDLNLNATAPEYPEVREEFFKIIDKKISELDVALSYINSQLSVDYSLYMDLKRNANTKAILETKKMAKKRLKSKAESLEPANYHAKIKALINLDESFLKVSNSCLSVLCVNQLKIDYLKWYSLSKSVNKNLDLEAAKMKKIDKINKFIKKIAKRTEEDALKRSHYLPVAITQQEYELVVREREIEKERDLVKQAEIAAEIAKKTEEARIAAEEAERKKEEINKKILQNIQCSEVVNTDSGLAICNKPYTIVDGEELHFATSDFDRKRHEAICKKIDMKATNFNRYSYYESNPKDSDAHTINRVLCEDSSKKIDPRLNGEIIGIEDGAYVIKNASYRFEDINLPFSTNADKDDLCKTLGFVKAARKDQWQTKNVSENTRGWITKTILITSAGELKFIGNSRNRYSSLPTFSTLYCE